jgi:release factor glutamine methyltransferase
VALLAQARVAAPCLARPQPHFAFAPSLRYTAAMQTLAQLLHSSTALLNAAHVDAPRRSAQILAAHALGFDRVGLLLHEQDLLSPEQAEDIQTLIARRALGEPVAYLVGKKEFYGRDFLLNTATLIPRPETELLIDYALDALPPHACTFADLGTGTGCIAISLACERPAWRGAMIDIAPQALAAACNNAERLHVAQRLLPVLGDMRRAPLAARSLDLVISNPPYIAHAEWENLSPEVRSFEPEAALFSPQQGLLHLLAAAQAAQKALRGGGLLIMEHGAGQGALLAQSLQKSSFWQEIEIHKDYANLDRFCSARAPQS